jgi:5-methylcytosine-specific restriction endonuclease McrA
MKRTPLHRRTPLRSRSPWLRPRPKGTIPLQTRLALQQRAHHRCERCKVPDRVRACQAHHRRLRSQGGPDTLENLSYLCWRCHGHVHDNRAESVAAGWIIPKGDA